jgi:hypothetical protein
MQRIIPRNIAVINLKILCLLKLVLKINKPTEDINSIPSNTFIMVGFDSKKSAEKKLLAIDVILLLLIRSHKKPIAKENSNSKERNIVTNIQSHIFCDLLIFKYYPLLNFCATSKRIRIPDSEIIIAL